MDSEVKLVPSSAPGSGFFSGEIDEMEQTGAAKCSASLFGVQRAAQRSFTNAARPEPVSRVPNGTFDPLMRL